VSELLSKKIIGIVAATLLATGLVWAQAAAPAAPKAPAVKDQGEYDLIQSVQKEKDPSKQLDLLKQWEQKYPESEFKNQRTLSEVQAEQQIAGAAYGKTDPALLDAGIKASHDIIDNLDKYFDAGVKPAAVTDADWAKFKHDFALQANTVLGYALMTKKTDDAAAEAAFKKALELDQNAAQVSYWLGTIIYRQRKVERIPEALYDFARAVVVTGPEALPAANKKPAEDFLTKAYTSFHGSADGLEDLKKAAAAGPMPPTGFKIESVTEISAKQEGDAAAFAAAHPDVALWRQIRDALKAPDGQTYFGNIKGSEVPPQEGAAFKMFNAKVVSQPSPKELLVNVDNLAGDATLQFETPLKGTIDPGTMIKFKGVIESFVGDPYMLTFSGLGKEDVEGIPATAFATTPARRPRPTPKKTK
jgi:tetratricopeptide (TPR) repeat protein